jgi:NAD(P)H-dependent FMN reductase
LAKEDREMRNRTITVIATLLGLSLLGSARAESLNSKLADMAAASAGDSKGASEEQAAPAVPVDDAERQVLDAEARDATNRALENARDKQK